MELKEYEKKVLMTTYHSVQETNNIQDNHLYDYQKEALQKMRSLIDYLENKYEPYHFKIDRYEPKTIDTSRDFYSFSLENEEVHYHAIYDGSNFKDDFYAYIITPIFENKIEQTLIHYNKVWVKTFFKTLYGNDVELVNMIENPLIIRDTEIFIKGINIDIHIIKTLLQEKQIVGNFRIYQSENFTEDLSIDDLWEIVKNDPLNIDCQAFRI